MTQARVGPTTAPEAAFSMAPPIISSTSSAFLGENYGVNGLYCAHLELIGQFYNIS